MKKILVVEDDDTINGLLYELLSQEYQVMQAYAGSEAMRIVEQESVDLILLDLMLPGLTGEAFIESFRKKSDIPIIVITAKTEMSVLANVLSIGANDFIAKPFNTIEVIARVQAQLRDHIVKESEGSLHKIGTVEMNEVTREVFICGKPVSLTQKEYELLKCFIEHPKKVFTKANLFETVWQEPYFGDDNTISVHISRLRRKLSEYSGEEVIETVWGVGFKFNLNNE
ncbi:response regulator transcription factor [Marinilactibacillus kalidii]|uniref:response regulator transcription factor n=1 Tax=Marinilactibacillus kalidii TaxID=2820274 RepID=UPI001ABEA0AC|nr:response regulator transcription factor [Marinilactibacillus kalidii]